MIVPLVPVLEMLDDSLVEAGYDLGGKSSQWFPERIHTPFITRFNRAPGSAFGFVLLAAPSLAGWMGLKLGGQSCPVHSEHVRSLCKPLLPSAPDRLLPRAAGAGAADVQRAIAAARRAFDEGPWRDSGTRERARWLHRIAEAIAAD